MSEYGTALQAYNQELVKGLEDFKIKQSELQEIINKEESDKVFLEGNIMSVQEKLNHLNNNLLQHRNLHDNYDRAIKEAENNFKKMLESSQTFLNLLQHETSKLGSSVGAGTHFSMQSNVSDSLTLTPNK